MPSTRPYQMHDDFLLSRFQSGIKLLKPERHSQASSRLKDAMGLPMNVYFTDGNGLIRKLNDSVANILQLSSINDSLGKSLFDITSQNNAKILRDNDQFVMDSQQIKFFDEQYLKPDGQTVVAEYLTIKSPWYDENNNIIGIFGCSIPTNTPSWSRSFLYLQQLGLLNDNVTTKANVINFPGKDINGVYITKREKEILTYLSYYHTAKRVGTALNISYRTVEMHIANLKEKFQVKTKADLLDLFLEQ